MADEVRFSWDDLTVGEVIDIEDISGVPIDELQKEGAPKGKALLAMLYVAKRRENPDFTLDDARAMPVSALNAITGEEERPTSAVGS